MKLYLYSIFVRFFLAFSGFLVFLLTAYLYGAEGRGVIAYGTSLFAIFGIIFSGNLGRAYISRTRQNDELKRRQLGGFLVLNLILCCLAVFAGISYWFFSETSKEMLTLSQVIFFSLTAFFHVWSVNGNSFYAAFVATKNQENIILGTRVFMIIFLGIVYFLFRHNINGFIVGYSIVLLLGVLAEMYWLNRHYSGEDRFPVVEAIKSSFTILKDSFYHHIDHLVFYIFPLVLTVLSASFLTKSEVGKFNFALQMINLIFLFSATANIRLTTYVSDVGFRARISQFKKLFWATLGVSCFSVIMITAGLAVIIKYHLGFQQFEGVSWLFLICSISVPGYVLYQFFSPIWVELKREKNAAAAHGINFAFAIGLAPLVLRSYGLGGLAVLFSLFYCGLILCQLYLYRRFLVFSIASVRK